MPITILKHNQPTEQAAVEPCSQTDAVHVQDQNQSPDNELNDLTEALAVSNADNEKLLAELKALNEQMAANENRSRIEIQNLNKALSSARAGIQVPDEWELLFHQKDAHIFYLQQCTDPQKKETQRVRLAWKNELQKLTSYFQAELSSTKEHRTKKVTEINRASKDQVAMLDSEWENRWFIRQEEVAAEFYRLQEEKNQLSQVLLEKEEVLKELTADEEAVSKEEEQQTKTAEKEEKERKERQKEEKREQEKRQKEERKELKEKEKREKKEKKELEEKEKREKKEREKREKEEKKLMKEKEKREKKEREEAEKLKKQELKKAAGEKKRRSFLSLFCCF